MLGAVWKGEKKGRRERGQNGMSRKRQRTATDCCPKDPAERFRTGGGGGSGQALSIFQVSAATAEWGSQQMPAPCSDSCVWLPL